MKGYTLAIRGIRVPLSILCGNLDRLFISEFSAEPVRLLCMRVSWWEGLNTKRPSKRQEMCNPLHAGVYSRGLPAAGAGHLAPLSKPNLQQLLGQPGMCVKRYLIYCINYVVYGWLSKLWSLFWIPIVVQHLILRVPIKGQ